MWQLIFCRALTGLTSGSMILGQAYFYILFLIVV